VVAGGQALDLLLDHCWDLFPLVTFNVDANCANCEGNADQSIQLSALRSIEMSQIEPLSEVPPGVTYPGFDTLTPAWRATLALSYAIPIDVPHSPDIRPLRVLLTRSKSTGQLSVDDIW
jgi:hypothetical protein